MNHSIYPVFNDENAGSVLAAWGKTAATQLSWRRLDGNVQIVTELHLGHLGVGVPSTGVVGLRIPPVRRSVRSPSRGGYAKKF